MPTPDQQSYRRRHHYKLGTEFSGLERPRQWVRLILSIIGAIAAMALVAFVAFG
jgi:hypothetical protein